MIFLLGQPDINFTCFKGVTGNGSALSSESALMSSFLTRSSACKEYLCTTAASRSYNTKICFINILFQDKHKNYYIDFFSAHLQNSHIIYEVLQGKIIQTNNTFKNAWISSIINLFSFSIRRG